LWCAAPHGATLGGMAESVTDIREKNERLETRLGRIRKQAQEATRRSVSAMAAAGGGFTAGYLQTRFPYLPGTEVPTDLAVGAVFVGAALADMAGSYNEELLAFGSGILAGGLAGVARAQFSEVAQAA